MGGPLRPLTLGLLLLCFGGGRGYAAPWTPEARGDTSAGDADARPSQVPALAPAERCTESSEDVAVTFEDPDLEAAIRAALSVGERAPLTCRLVSGVTSLPRVGGIQSLVGIQNLTSLTSIDFGFNAITDLSPLGGLRNLTAAYLESNPGLADISPLGALTSLRVLNLGDNAIRDIGPLSGLTGLTVLGLDANEISDISPLSRLTSLRVLYLDENPGVSDLSALGGLTELRVLHLARNRGLLDIGALRGLTRLTALDLDANSITDIGPLSELRSLRILYLAENPHLFDLGSLGGLTDLRVLHLGGNSNLRDISALASLTNLTGLDLSNDPELSDIQPLLDNPGLGAGDEVNLESTGVRCADVQALRAKGVLVPLVVQSTCR